MHVSRETSARLIAYVSALATWNRRIALVGPAQMIDLEDRAVAEADLIASVLAGAVVDCWIDLGSGGGLPAIPLAIVWKPLDTRLTLVEVDQRKAAFLRHALRETGLTATVVVERIEVAAPYRADLITARALAPLDVLAGYGHRHLAKDGRFLALKGRNVAKELDDLRRRWVADVKVHAGAGETVVVEMSGIEPKRVGVRNDA